MPRRYKMGSKWFSENPESFSLNLKPSHYVLHLLVKNAMLQDFSDLWIFLVKNFCILLNLLLAHFRVFCPNLCTFSEFCFQFSGFLNDTEWHICFSLFVSPFLLFLHLYSSLLFSLLSLSLSPILQKLPTLQQVSEKHEDDSKKSSLTKPFQIV